MRYLSRALKLVAAGAAGAAVLLASTGAPAAVRSASDAGTSRTAGQGGCPTGQVPDSLVRLAGTAAAVPLVCRPQRATDHDSARAMLAARSQWAARHQGVYPVSSEAFASAAAQGQAIAASPLYGASAWRDLGTDALHADDPQYGPTSEGFHNLSGRVQGFAADPTNSAHWYAAVANGGLWATTDAGQSWHSIGDTLPTQILGSVALAAGHTLVVGTGDPAFGGDSYSGLGAFWSTDEGSSWHRASGLPNGTLTFRVAVDPTNASIVYQATGKGLWRSTDAGRSYRNLALPTGCTSLTDPLCFFANIVSDVVVRPAGGAGNPADPGGEVLAAVGWRAGPIHNAAGQPEAPQDGIYVAADGQHFHFVDPAGSGFPAVTRAGRTALGLAYGAGQNHDYVYALVQDPQRFNAQTGTADLPTAPLNGTLAGTALRPSVLNGLYASKNFGQSWTLMADANQLDAPVHKSALGGTECTLGYCAGVQSWYNEWIQPSPAASETASDGSPLFLSFGLEEVWGGSAALPAVANTSNFAVFGRYFSGTTCAALTVSELMGFCPTTMSQQGSTVHPDQHAAMYVPTAGGQATLVVGNDGGSYAQTQQATASLTPYNNDQWAQGLNHNLHTLLPYDAEMSKDGTVYAGLQDNGEMKISPSGRQDMVYGGDGFMTAVDPNNSLNAYEEYTGGDISATKDGGKTWSNIQPCYASAQFAAPFLLDATNANHLLAGGSDIEETTAGSATTTPVQLGLTSTDKSTNCGPVGRAAFGSTTDWVSVFNLGTTGTFTNTASAVDTRGDASYAGFCGSCDVVTQGLPFHAGLATNVGGALPPKQMTSDGWHVASAAGLPQRVINSVMIDPQHASTVYVTLGGYGRRWIPPGSLGDDVSKIGSGHLFVSHDAGEHFTDISGNLPDLAANATVLHDGDLIVADDLGVFAAPARSLAGGAPVFTRVGTGLAPAPVLHLQITPRSPNELLAASYGRGAQLIELRRGSVPTGATSGSRTLPALTPVAALASRAALAATGAPAGLAALAVLLLIAALLVRRRDLGRS